MANRQKTSHFFIYSRRATDDPRHTWHGDRGGPCHFCTSLTFVDLISSFTTRGYWKLVGKCRHRMYVLITELFVPRKWPNLKVKRYLQKHTNAENFVKIVQRSRPWVTNLWPIFEILTLWGLYSHVSAPNERESLCQISRLLAQCVAKNPFFNHWVNAIPVSLHFAQVMGAGNEWKKNCVINCSTHSLIVSGMFRSCWHDKASAVNARGLCNVNVSKQRQTNVNVLATATSKVTELFIGPQSAEAQIIINKMYYSSV